MGLDVSPALLDAAERGDVPDEDFADCVHASLPYAWKVVSTLVTRLHVEGGDFADNTVAPPDETARGELLGAMASDAIRTMLERYFGVRIAFQICHRVAVFPRDSDEALRARFASSRAQVLNQSRDQSDCCRRPTPVVTRPRRPHTVLRSRP